MKHVIFLLFVWGLIMGISPEKYLEIPNNNYTLSDKVSKIVSLQSVLEQQMQLSYALQKAGQTSLRDSLVVYSHITGMVKYQAALALRAQRESIIKAHKSAIPRGWTYEQKIARADSILNGSLLLSANFKNSKAIYVEPKEVPKFRRVPKLPATASLK